MIDHHQSPEKFSTLFLSKPEIGSTCEIVYNIMKSINNELIDKEDIKIQNDKDFVDVLVAIQEETEAKVRMSILF